jgi:hypothetical protein
MYRCLALSAILATSLPALAAAQAAGGAAAQKPAQPPAQTGGQTPKQPPTEKLGPNLVRIGTIRVDTAAKEITVAGKINPDVRTLEFIANAREGVKAYETAVTLDTDAITFNAALLLIGIDRSRSKNIPTRHFDTAVPSGDVVEIWLDCPKKECQRFPAERLMFDQESKTPASKGTWVYTGSTFLSDGRYLAEVDGALIGFVHDPASIIEYAAGAGLNRYGTIVMNPTLGLKAGAEVTLTVKAVRGAAPGAEKK